MATPASITAVRTCHGIELGAHKVFAACAAVSAPGKDPDLVYKV
jgi:hypothetical protein